MPRIFNDILIHRHDRKTYPVILSVVAIPGLEPILYRSFVKYTMREGLFNMSNSSHSWRFFRAGGFDQVRLHCGADLANLDQLDQKLWVALACSTSGLEFDRQTLDLIDTDKDGRIRAPEIIAAAKWACSLLKNPDDLLKSSPTLPLSAINDATPLGKQMLASARQVLSNLGKSDTSQISVSDTTDTVALFALTRFNGDGIITADVTDDPALKALMNDMLACLPALTDRSGKPGINTATVDQFYAQLQAFADWYSQGEKDAATIMPLGDATAPALAALNIVKSKIEDYFTRCHLAAFDPRAASSVNRHEADYTSLLSKDLSANGCELSDFPLAMAAPGKALPLSQGINPAWADAMASFVAKAVTPLLGNLDQLTESDWLALCGKLSAYNTWSAGKSGALVEKLGITRIREILAGDGKTKLAELIAQDAALEPDFAVISAVDQLTRYHRDLYKLLVNFVNFQDFYGRKDKAVFQVGRLYLDQRSCDLCVKVEDAARHATMAPLSQAYLVYCDVVRKATGEKMSIAAAMTNGDCDNLMVGRNGIFYDRQGHDWDATITKIIDNPISIRQAFWAPYKRLIRWIQEQVAKRAAAADAARQTQLQTGVTTTADAAAAGKAPAPASPPPGQKMDVGIIAAFSLAFGFVATAFAGIMNWLAGTPTWMLPFYVLLLLLLISGPSMVIAWLKLRQRNLGPILDANGWAVNSKAKINIPFGKSLTAIATLPPNSQRELVDPFAEKKTARVWAISIALLLVLLTSLWYFDVIEKALPGLLPKSGYLIRQEQRDAEKAALTTVKTELPGEQPANREEASASTAPAAAPPPALP